MSEHDGSDDDPSILAGEYVLGVLDEQERARCAARRRTDPLFDQLVTAWERHLMPAGSALAPVAPPPELRNRIEAEMRLDASPSVRRMRRELWVWRGLSAASAVLACGLLAAMWVRPATRIENVTAMLAPGSSGFLVRVTERNIQLDAVRPVPLSAGHDLELWSLAAGASAPRSLGVLPVTGVTLPTGTLPFGEVQLLVSVEPTGGSPSGAPTGPVILSATVHRTE